MWRFWNGIQRAFRHHVYNPRPSAGLHVEEEQEAVDKAEHLVCPFSRRKWSSKPRNESRCLGNTVPNSTFINKESNKHENGCTFEEHHHNNNTDREEGPKWWKTCHPALWGLLHGSHRMLEAISVGSAMLWGSDVDRCVRKTRLLYRVLFVMPGSGSTIKTIKDPVSSVDSVRPEPVTIREPRFTTQLAIKDAAGAAHDAAVNISKSETLDVALEEFQAMCTEYTARNESLLGLQAAENGDMAAAVDHLRSSCSLGNMSACFNLGLCYETGSGVSQDLSKAKQYYKKAAKGGHSMAMYNLGLMYLGNDDSDSKQSGDVADHSERGREKGIQLLEQAARLGLAEAQTYLGIHHYEESGDARRAVPYFLAAADQNDTEAQYFLAICYEKGLGVTVNECRAAQLYSLAASGGHELAMYNLAVFNEYGLGGLPEDQTAAIELYQKSAQLGCEQAKTRLEQIQAEKAAAAAQWQEKVDNFHQLYHKHHHGAEAETLNHQAASLSPSASSPDLTQYLNKGLNYFFGNHPVQFADSMNHQSSSEADSHSGSARIHDENVSFQLGRFYEGDDEGDGFEGEQIESIARGKPCSPLSGLHRSHTYPNFSLVACSI